MLTAHNKFHYQYMIRDHLGNTRMLLNAEEQPQQSYPNCDFEDDHARENQTYYLNAGPETYLITPPPGFNTSEGTGVKCQLIKNNDAPVGVGKLLKVMVTDEVGVKLDYYIPTAPVDNTGSNPMGHLIESIIAILNNTGYSGAMHGGGTDVGAGFEHDVTLNSLLYPQSAGNPSPNTVKAYLNILFFDDAFNFVCEQSQYVQLSVMGTAQTVTLLGSSMIAAPANGYAYIYVSNESRNPVFIDNFQVVHRPGRVVQDVSYYPFGMQMAGISSGAANGIENKRKFNGIEYNNKFDLNIGEAIFRTHDSQTGRWWQIDPKSEKYHDYSPYCAMGNNPILIPDILGDEIEIPYTETVTNKRTGKTKEVARTFVWEPGKKYTGKNEGLIATISALNKIYEKKDELSITQKDDNGKEVSGNVLTDFLKGGKFEKVTVTVYPNMLHNKSLNKKGDGWGINTIWFNQNEGIDILAFKDQVAGKQAPFFALLHEFGHVWLNNVAPNTMENPTFRYGDSKRGNPNEEQLILDKVQNKRIADAYGQPQQIYYNKSQYGERKGPLSNE